MISIPQLSEVNRCQKRISRLRFLKKKKDKKKKNAERISFPSKLILGVNQKVIIESEYHFCQ